MSARARAVAIRIVIAVAVIGGVVWWLQTRDRGAGKSTAAPQGSGAKPSGNARGGGGGDRVVPVQVATAERKSLPIWLEGLGTVAAFQQVTVRAQVDGRLDKVLFEEGKPVKQGEVIAQIDPRPFLVQLHQAQGALARDKAQLDSAKKNLERFKGLQNDQLVAARQVEEIQAQVGQFEGSVKIDQAQVESAQLMLDYAKVKAQIDNALYDAFGDRQVATFYTQVNQFRVILEAGASVGSGPDALGRVYVSSPAGQVPLSELVRVKPTNVALTVSHQGQFPSTTISFNTAPGVSLEQATKAVERATLDIGMPASIHASFAGTAAVFRDSLATQPLLILIALIAVYIVLGMLYESYIHPLTILSTLPSAGLGALLALMLTNSQLDLIALVGIILLIGIVKKNAILMIDFALELERDGKDPVDAIYEACVLRFRPILMTTLAALFGALPLALGSGMGSELRKPLGIAIVGGLAVSQLLTLFTTPVTYLALHRFTRNKKPESIALV